MKIPKPNKTAPTLFTALLPILAAGLLAACGKKEEAKPEGASSAQSATSAAIGVPAAIVVTGNDQMQFNLKAIEVAAGSEVTIVFQNVGTMAKEVMGHNLIILNPGVSVPDFGTKAMTAKETDYIPASEAASIFANTRLLGPGESDTLKFTAPAAGEYPYLCSFPGHFAVMQGVMTVK